MKIQEILSKTAHRPWNLPEGQWKFYQEWNNALFLHWQVDESELRKFVPDNLEIDLINGNAWVSLVAFDMERIRPKSLPAFPPISNFHEINIRTYVKYKGKTGVYFLSIEGGKKISCFIAKKVSELPYRYSKMERKSNFFSSKNSEYKDQMEIKFKVGPKYANKSNLDNWLTERYALIQDGSSCINLFHVHHVEWPTYEIELEDIKIDYPRFSNLINNTPNLSHYSPGVQVVAWDK